MKASDIQTWLTDYICRVLQVPAEEVLPDREFTSFGLDSAAAVGLSVDLGAWLGSEVDPTVTYDYPTIESVSLHIENTLRAAKRPDMVSA